MILDGAHGEGGGQILRTAVALSCVTGREIEIHDIRARRPKPGLAAQHLAGLRAAAALAGAEASGLSAGSTSISFSPAEIRGGCQRIDIGTAGAITLVVQTLLVPSLRAREDVVLEISGGTDVAWSPSIAYFRNVFCAFLGMMGIDIATEIIGHGFYPAGGGNVRITVKPARNPHPLAILERGKMNGMRVTAIASDSLRKARVAERMVGGARDFLGRGFDEERVQYVPTPSPGCCLHLDARFENTVLGASCLGEKGKKAEEVGNEAARLLERQLDSGACLDEWMADQIIPYLALFGGKVSVSKMTDHARTNMWVCEQFGARFTVEGNVIESRTTIKC